jgi:aryl-alcohol dehydrogenase-like predicted oxidoreductase
MPGVAKFVSSQPQYSMLWREPEDEIIPLCAANGISQIVWSPLGQGVLSGKYDPDKQPPRDSRAASEEMGGFMDRLLQPEVLRAVRRLKPIAEEAGLTLPQFALAWVLREPNVASAIIGASRPEQVRENAAASGVIVDTQLFLRAEQILDDALRAVESA